MTVRTGPGPQLPAAQRWNGSWPVPRRLPTHRRRCERLLHHDERVRVLPRQHLPRRPDLCLLEGGVSSEARLLSLSSRSTPSGWSMATPASRCGPAHHRKAAPHPQTAARNSSCRRMPEEANGTGSSTHLMVWTLSNTSSLGTATPSLNLTLKTLNCRAVRHPTKSDQKSGDFPQGQCLNIPACATAILLGVPDPLTEVISHLNSTTVACSRCGMRTASCGVRSTPR